MAFVCQEIKGLLTYLLKVLTPAVLVRGQCYTKVAPGTTERLRQPRCLPAADRNTDVGLQVAEL